MILRSCRNISRIDFEGFLDYYDALVKAKYCPKLSYSVWKSLKNIMLKNDDIKTLTVYSTEEKEFLEFILENSPYMYTRISIEYAQDDVKDSAFFDSLLEYFPFLTYKVEENVKVKDEYVNNRKEDNIMNPMKNFNFGPCGDTVKLSPYGMAVHSNKGWVSYDTNSGDVIDVDGFIFDHNGFLYTMPVAVKDIAVGDIVIHMGKPMFVTGFMEDTGNPIVIDIMAGERKEILPIKNMFNFNFYTKVVNLMESMMGNTVKPTEDNPFGNMWMFMLMGGDNNFKDMLPFMMMNGNMDFSSNPMLMYLLLDKNK